MDFSASLLHSAPQFPVVLTAQILTAVSWPRLQDPRMTEVGTILSVLMLTQEIASWSGDQGSREESVGTTYI